MPLEHWFRLSQYLTLGLSCAALVFAEVPFLPELQFCLAPILALLFFAWWIEGRWIVPNWGANILGSLIAAGGLTWLVTQSHDKDQVLWQLPLHLALLPYMGPLLMAALLVKVFRSHDAGHFWHLQGWGLSQIALGCLLDGGPAFGAMMAAYLASDLVCLALHYRLSSQRGASDEGRVARTDDPTLAPRPLPLVSFKLLFVFTLRWTLVIWATTLLLFLLTPRRDSWGWEPLNKVRTGYRNGTQGTNEEMNLNNIGRVELDDAIALRVEASDAAGQPKLDLPADQRWRGSVLDWYEHGKWTTIHPIPVKPGRSSQVQLPNLGPDQFFLTFKIQPYQAGGLVLAEPIRLGRFPTRLPVISVAKEERRGLFVEFAGTVLPQVASDERHQCRYCQVVPSMRDPDRVPAESLWPHIDFLEILKTVPSEIQDPLQGWTVELLRRLSQSPHYHLPEGVRTALVKPSQDNRIEEAHWEALGRALTSYLSRSGEFSYSLEMTRQDRSLDPVLDFLFNIRRGHCERFAAALALMLRSVGVPARVVKGYRGCDHQGDGEYVVRHSHAHAWVEILVPHSATANGPDVASLRNPHFDWLILDATPSESAAPTRRSSWSNLWGDTRQFCLQWWRSLIVDYGVDEQADLWNALISVRSWSRLLNFALGFAMCGAGFALWLLVRRLRFSPSSIRSHGDVAIYPRLVRILTRYASLRPRLGQTPLEYSTAAQAILQTRPTFASLADVPGRIVGLFYRVRFGRQRLSEGERQQINSELDRFAEVLRQPQ